MYYLRGGIEEVIARTVAKKVTDQQGEEEKKLMHRRKDEEENIEGESRDLIDSAYETSAYLRFIDFIETICQFRYNVLVEQPPSMHVAGDAGSQVLVSWALPIRSREREHEESMRSEWG